jgi:hypothetical protein
MERIEPEALRFLCPLFSDELVRFEPLEGLQSSAEVVGGNEVIKVLSELGVIVVMITLDRSFVTVRPRLQLPISLRLEALQGCSV